MQTFFSSATHAKGTPHSATMHSSIHDWHMYGLIGATMLLQPSSQQERLVGILHKLVEAEDSVVRLHHSVGHLSYHWKTNSKSKWLCSGPSLSVITTRIGA